MYVPTYCIQEVGIPYWAHVVRAGHAQANVAGLLNTRCDSACTSIVIVPVGEVSVSVCTWRLLLKMEFSTEYRYFPVVFTVRAYLHTLRYHYWRHSIYRRAPAGEVMPQPLNQPHWNHKYNHWTQAYTSTNMKTFLDCNYVANFILRDSSRLLPHWPQLVLHLVHSRVKTCMRMHTTIRTSSTIAVMSARGL